MKFQRSDAHVIAAVFTPPAADFDEALLTLDPPPFLAAVGRSAPPFSPIGIGPRPCSDRSLGRVVSSERRARQTELPPIKGSKFSLDDLLGRETTAALLTNQGSGRASRIEARAVPRLEWQTLEALPSPVQMATLTVDDRVVAER
jgi:hypothetical protein